MTYEKPRWSEYEAAGFSREEYRQDLHDAYLASLTLGERIRRDLWINAPKHWLMGALLALVLVLTAVELWWS